jgi:CHAT domain-containing protein
VTALNGKEATVEAVLRSMKACNWIHFACYAIQDFNRPTNSAFLINGQLTLEEIMKQSFSHTELAVLSACQTAMGDSELPEEAIHLAAGMLMVGYGSVVGTMWSIFNDDGPIIAEKFYRYLIGEAGGDSTKAAYALHHAVGHLRDSKDGRGFARWVPFIHLGLCSPRYEPPTPI